MACALVGSAAMAGEAALPRLDELRWVSRAVIIFADTEADPRVKQQLRMLEDDASALEDRDVVILVDTDPAAKSELRQTYRPREFRLMLIDKDGTIVYRKPEPVPARDLIRLIDRLPSRKRELLGQ